LVEIASTGTWMVFRVKQSQTATESCVLRLAQQKPMTVRTSGTKKYDSRQDDPP